MRPTRTIIHATKFFCLPVALVVQLGWSVVVADDVAKPPQIGDVAPMWEGLPGTDDNTHDAKELIESAKATVVVFTCNSCPYAVDIQERLIDLSAKFKEKGVAVVAINVNKVEEDRLPAMKEAARKHKFNFPYLYDETQAIARQFGAVYTPTFFVMNKDWKVVYKGALDDSPSGKEVAKRHVEDAITETLAGKSVTTPETPAIGCRVRYERVRRSRRVR